MPLPTIPDSEGIDAQALVRELVRAKCAVQLRTISLIMGAPYKPVDEQDWRRGVARKLAEDRASLGRVA